MENWNSFFKINFLDKAKSFFNKPLVVTYFFTIVVIVGSFGVWYNSFDFRSCYNNFFVDNETLTNLATYTISILATTMATVLLSKKVQTNSFKIFSFAIFILAFLSAVISLVKFNWVFGYCGLILTYILWMIVYSDDESLSDNPNAPTGGANPEAQIIPGDISSFKS